MVENSEKQLNLITKLVKSITNFVAHHQMHNFLISYSSYVLYWIIAMANKTCVAVNKLLYKGGYKTSVESLSSRYGTYVSYVIRYQIASFNLLTDADNFTTTIKLEALRSSYL